MSHSFAISVKALIETCERRGDINFRFSGRSSAMAGIRGHQRIQRSRGDEYVAEKPVSDTVERGNIVLTVSGRVDGYVPGEPLVVEEIKTIRANASEIPETVKQVHWGQAKAYGALLASEFGANEVCVRLCYLELDDDREHIEEQTFQRAALDAFYDRLVECYVTQVERSLDWLRTRNASIGPLPFPYASYRNGQRDMAVSAYRALKNRAGVVLQAPTGIGKTIGALYPAIKSLSELDYDKVFYLTAKGSGGQLARNAVSDLRDKGLKLRDVTLTAKDKICFNPGSPCDPEHCEYAREYYDRLPAIMEEAGAMDKTLDREAIETLAREHTVCPFELSLDLSREADVVICDYNYVFDPNVYLRRFFEDVKGRYALLVDESHNLVDRGRDMFSAVVEKEAFMALKREIGTSLPLVKKRLDAVNRAFLAIRKQDREHFEQNGYLQFDEVPVALTRALRGFCEAAEDWLARNEPAVFQPRLLEQYFDALRFVRVSESVDDNFAILLVAEKGRTRLKLACLDPSPGLSLGFARATARICFSATMAPQPYFKKLLGLGEDADWYRIDSPFEADHLGVFTAPFISTAFRDRTRSLYELVDVIAGVVSARTGNYLAYFPSHAYLAAAATKFIERYPGYECVVQTPGMDREDRDAFLAAFHENSAVVGFAVMGGIFGEGVDLVGTRLIGVVIAGVGLPQLSIERELIRAHFDRTDDRTDDGFRYAYQYPGINRVLQTAGRVIRSESDRGVVCLVDRRFEEPGYRELLPADWHVRSTAGPGDLEQALGAFWQSA